MRHSLRDVKAEAGARSRSGAPPSAGAEEEDDEEEIDPGDVARQALACLRETAAEAAAYRASEGSEPPPPSTVRALPRQICARRAAPQRLLPPARED